MKIMHICLASHYTEGMTYQDNQLSDQNSRDGHEVVVISDCYSFEGAEIKERPEEDRLLASGVRLVRFKYDRIINKIISSKIRKVKKLYPFIVNFKPDVILFHGVAGWEMLTVAKYKKKYPKTKLYIDSHEDIHNSGTFWISMFFQYKLFNKLIVKCINKYVDKFLYLSHESKFFLTRIYGLCEDKMEFYPLGGNVVSNDYKNIHSLNIRNKHNLKNDDVLVIHSGKLDAKKRTQELLNAFYAIKNKKLKLFIIGSIPDDMKTVLLPLIDRDDRVFFIGWKSGAELIQYLCAADLYFQPGTQSATMQNAICCGSPVTLFPYTSHQPYIKGNGFFVQSEADFIEVFDKIGGNPKLINEMKQNSLKVARELLDYKQLAARLYK